MSIYIRILWISFSVIVWALAFEGNLGKGLACLLTPKTLEVVGVSGGDTSPTTLPAQAQ